MRKGQGRKPLLNACDLRALRQHCMKNCHAAMMNIATGAQECCRKSLSLNKVCRCIQTPKFMVISDGPKDSGTCFAVRGIYVSAFFLENQTSDSLSKTKKTTQTLLSKRCNSQPCDGTICVTCICAKVSPTLTMCVLGRYALICRHRSAVKTPIRQQQLQTVNVTRKLLYPAKVTKYSTCKSGIISLLAIKTTVSIMKVKVMWWQKLLNFF